MYVRNEYLLRDYERLRMSLMEECTSNEQPRPYNNVDCMVEINKTLIFVYFNNFNSYINVIEMYYSISSDRSLQFGLVAWGRDRRATVDNPPKGGGYYVSIR